MEKFIKSIASVLVLIAGNNVSPKISSAVSEQNVQNGSSYQRSNIGNPNNSTSYVRSLRGKRVTISGLFYIVYRIVVH